MKKLSIVILNHNTKELLTQCLSSLERVRNELDFEVVVSDNASSDGSVEAVKSHFPWVKLVINSDNIGFAAGNNRAKKLVSGEYILFLNSDTEVYPGTLKGTVSYMEGNHDIGALTCKIVLPNGQVDKDARRSFPTPWVAFTHFSGLDRVFPGSPVFSKYWYGYESADKVHEVDVIQGAYFLARAKILDEVEWFDEDYFLDGEDIDLSWKIRQKGWKIVYYPKVSILHVKKATKKKVKGKFKRRGVEAMEIFYRKRLWGKYPVLLNLVIIFAIRVLGLARSI